MLRLDATFLQRDATVVAPALLNKVIVVHGTRARITEVEAYTQDDPASHSCRGRTLRNSSMFGPAGRWYVYLIYGVHHCLNIVTGLEGDGQAVLVRSAVIDGVDARLSRGPGRLCRVLGVDRSLDGSPALIFDDGVAPPARPEVTARIGISRAVDRPWRWLVGNA